MKTTITFCFLLCTMIGVRSQTCACFISEVETNSVTPCDKIIGEVITVSNTQELKAAFQQVNQSGGNMTILLEDGEYPIASTTSYPYITASNLVIRSASGNRDAVIITGQGMRDVAPATEIGISLQGDNVTIADLTIRDVGNHAIAMIGDNHLFHNLKLQDTYEQIVKGNNVGDGADNCTLQCSLLEYTDGIGPQWYIGGIDIHAGNSWMVRDNIFRNISSPSQQLAEHAVHFWSGAADNTVERNMIYNCDRGIGFGLGSSPNEGGIIRNNMIYNDGTNIFHDVGIGLESSPFTEVYHNSIYIQYPNAIEYRFESTTDVVIYNNVTNRAIKSRNGGGATLSTNITDAQSDWFEDLSSGNLRLSSPIVELVDVAIPLPNINDDIDQAERSQGLGNDIGASEFPSTTTSTSLVDQDIFHFSPNPSKGEIFFPESIDKVWTVYVINVDGKICGSCDESQYCDLSHLPNGIY